jgi:hypothetical protein
MNDPYFKPEPVESRNAYCPYHEGMALMLPRGTSNGHPQFECSQCLAWVVIPRGEYS